MVRLFVDGNLEASTRFKYVKVFPQVGPVFLISCGRSSDTALREADAVGCDHIYSIVQTGERSSETLGVSLQCLSMCNTVFLIRLPAS